jgi:hypothetical protein
MLGAKDYVQSTNGQLTLHFLPGYAPELDLRRAGIEPCKAHQRGQDTAAHR